MTTVQIEDNDVTGIGEVGRKPHSLHFTQFAMVLAIVISDEAKNPLLESF